MREPIGHSLPVTLVGRDRELAVLRDCLDATRAGQGSLVLIGGEAGIGKTALAETILHEAALAECVVLEGHCFDLAETPPYGPFIDLFAHLPAIVSCPPLPAAFSQRGTVGAVASQMELFVAVEDFLSALATTHPVVVLLDDLHWADPASLDLLRFLARSLASLPLLLIVTYRSDELTRRHPLYALLPQVAREASTTRIDLNRLDEDAMHLLVAARYRLPDADNDRLVQYLQARAEGNALFVGELLRALEEAGTLAASDTGWRLGAFDMLAVPALLRQVIDSRVSRLSDAAQRLLAVAAVIGQKVPLSVWAAVAETDEDAMLDSIEQGLDAQLLVEVPGGTRVRFAHALIREALYEGTPAMRRRRIHQRVGAALAATDNADPDAVAFHFQQAGDARAVPWLRKAGERAQAAYAWVMAATRFEAAVALMERTDADAGERGWLLLRIGRLLHFFEAAKARGFAGEAIVLAIAANDHVLAATARVYYGMIECQAGDVASGLPKLEVGADALTRLTDAERARIATHFGRIGDQDRWGSVVVWRALIGRYREARELGESLVATVGDDEALQRLQDGMFGLGIAYAMLGMPDEATAMLSRAHASYFGIGGHVNASIIAQIELRLVALPYRTGEIAGRQRLAERAEEGWRRASGVVSASIPPRFMHLPLLVLEGAVGGVGTARAGVCRVAGQPRQPHVCVRGLRGARLATG